MAVLAKRIDQGRDGGVSPGIHARTVAGLLVNTIVGLWVVVKTCDAPVGSGGFCGFVCEFEW